MLGGLPNTPGCRPPPECICPPGCRSPPGCRHPWMQTPWMQTPWMQTLLDADPPGCRLAKCRPPGCRPPWSCDLWCMLESQPLWTEWHTSVKTLSCPKLCLRAVTTKLCHIYHISLNCLSWKTQLNDTFSSTIRKTEDTNSMQKIYYTSYFYKLHLGTKVLLGCLGYLAVWVQEMVQKQCNDTKMCVCVLPFVIFVVLSSNPNEMEWWPGGGVGGWGGRAFRWVGRLKFEGSVCFSACQSLSWFGWQKWNTKQSGRGCVASVYHLLKYKCSKISESDGVSFVVHPRWL